MLQPTKQTFPNELGRESSFISASFFTLAPILLTTYNSRKYRMFFILPSNHQNMHTSRNSIWLANNTESSQGHKTRLYYSFAKPFPWYWSSTTRSKFLKSNLLSDLFHGYKDLAGQSSWWSILFCVYVYIHRSKAVALFAQFLSSLPQRYSTNERRPW